MDRVKLERQMHDIVEMITHPEFVEAMRNMKAADPNERQEVGRQTLTPNALKERGVPMPENMRITSRYFEASPPEIIDVNQDGVIIRTPQDADLEQAFGFSPSEVAWGGCACGGAATVCGGAGGST